MGNSRSDNIRIGISGWRYVPWRGVFYPGSLPQHRELEFAASRFASVEINGSFYSLQRPESYARWHDATPDDFVFSVKGSRYITHMLRLRNVETPLANFFASGLFNLKAKLGPFLWQFPPNFRYDAEKLERFFELLPRDTGQALRLARHRDARMRGRSRLAIDAVRPLRHAIEIRHESFRDPGFISLLRRQGIALVVADTAGKWPHVEDLTADFVYVRLHGDKEIYSNGYTNRALDRWAKRIDAWSRGSQPEDARLISDRSARARRSRDVYVYFDNDIKVKAPFDALNLADRLGLQWQAARRRATLPGLPRRRVPTRSERRRDPWPQPAAAR